MFQFLKITIASILFSFLLFSCAPVKEDVTEADLNRVLDRMAGQRVATGLRVEEGKPLPSDWEIFQESCKIFRLDPDTAMNLLEEKNPKLHRTIRETKEKGN